MSDGKSTRVYFEGNDDKAFLEQLGKTKRLPETWKLDAGKRTASGKEGVLAHLISFVSPVNGLDGRAVVLLDLDQQSYAAFFASVSMRLSQLMPSVVDMVAYPPEKRLQYIEFKHAGDLGQLVVVAVGRPDHPTLGATYGIDSFSLDDWIFPLLWKREVYEANSDFANVPFDTAMKKYGEVADLFRANKLTVNKSKAFLQILKAACGGGPSSATTIQRVIEKSYSVLGPAGMEAELAEILADLDRAAELLRR